MGVSPSRKQSRPTVDAAAKGISARAEALRGELAAVLTPFTYAQIVPAVALGFVLFGAVPDAWAAVGTAILIGAGIYVVQRRVARTGGQTAAAPLHPPTA